MTDDGTEEGALSGKEEGQVQQPVQQPPGGDAPKMEIDGKKVVHESDLIAAKESLQAEVKAARDQATTDLTKAQSDMARVNSTLAEANAKITQLETAQGQTTSEEIDKHKQTAETAGTERDTANASALTYRREAIAAKHRINPDDIKDKTMPELDAFESALTALANARPGGDGPYAINAGSLTKAPMTEKERATSVLASTPYRGVRNPPQE